MFDKKTGRKGTGTPNVRSWDSGPVSSEGGRGNQWSSPGRYTQGVLVVTSHSENFESGWQGAWSLLQPGYLFSFPEIQGLVLGIELKELPSLKFKYMQERRPEKGGGKSVQAAQEGPLRHAGEAGVLSQGQHRATEEL